MMKIENTEASEKKRITTNVKTQSAEKPIVKRSTQNEEGRKAENHEN